MTRGKAEDAGGLTPAKDDNAAPYHFDRRTLPIFKCVDYKAIWKSLWPCQTKNLPEPLRFREVFETSQHDRCRPLIPCFV